MKSAGAAARRPIEREASMATWAARASTKGSGHTSLFARLRDEDGPSKSLVLALPLPPFRCDEDDDDAEEADDDDEEDIKEK